jgi:hypothetical protein
MASAYLRATTPRQHLSKSSLAVMAYFARDTKDWLLRSAQISRQIQFVKPHDGLHNQH